MPPNKKGNKKANDDWESELGESPAPVSAEAPATVANGDDDETSVGGGLMARMKKIKEKRKKKGLTEDFVEGEDATAAEPQADLAAKAPAEAAMDDEFALPDKKGKGAKGKQPVKPVSAKADADGLDDGGDGGRVLTKAEKEKLKKEREKLRKKEQVRIDAAPAIPC